MSTHPPMKMTPAEVEAYERELCSCGCYRRSHASNPPAGLGDGACGFHPTCTQFERTT